LDVVFEFFFLFVQRVQVAFKQTVRFCAELQVAAQFVEVVDACFLFGFVDDFVEMGLFLEENEFADVEMHGAFFGAKKFVFEFLQFLFFFFHFARGFFGLVVVVDDVVVDEVFDVVLFFAVVGELFEGQGFVELFDFFCVVDHFVEFLHFGLVFGFFCVDFFVEFDEFFVDGAFFGEVLVGLFGDFVHLFVLFVFFFEDEVEVVFVFVVFFSEDVDFVFDVVGFFDEVVEVGFELAELVFFLLVCFFEERVVLDVVLVDLLLNFVFFEKFVVQVVDPLGIV
jgi:hypothetical protein